MNGHIEHKEGAPKAIYLQWKDDFGEVLGETTWCFERIHVHDIRYVIDKRHLTSHSSRAAGACPDCGALWDMTKNNACQCGATLLPPPA